MNGNPDPVEPAVLDDLRSRLAATRRARLPGGTRWQRGTDADYLAELIDYWHTTYDWRRHEQRIHALPWVRAGGVRAIHQRAQLADGSAGATGGGPVGAPAGTAPAVLLLHGWPDSVLRYERLLPLLPDLDVVVPALPGYPFSEPVDDPDLSAAGMAVMIGELMERLGHDRYVISAGDIGRGVAVALAAARPDAVAALHLTDLPPGTALARDRAELGVPELEYRDALERWQKTGGGYQHEQSTRPHTLAVALADSPAGLAAWIVEKLREWSDCGGDVETVFSREDLLTWVTAYWVTGTIGTSFLPYVNPSPPVGHLDVATVVSVFPHDLVHPTREFAETLFEVRGWDEQPAGGHFAPWEQPQAYARAVRAAVELAQ